MIQFLEYKGGQFVKVEGEQTGEISDEKVRELVDSFYEAGYFSINDEYTAQITDLPTTTTSLTIDGKRKQVVNYFNAPEELEALENKIDEISNSQQWVGK